MLCSVYLAYISSGEINLDLTSLLVLRSMGQGPGGISPLPIGSMLVPLPGGRPAAVNWYRGTVRQATLGSSKCCKSRFVEVLQVSSPVGGLGFAAAPAPLAFVSVRFRLSSCLIRWTAGCVVYSS